MLSVLTGSVVSTIVIVIALAAILRKEVNAKGGCPQCGTPVPMLRNPTSLRQALWGGWTCSLCHTEMDRHGNKLSETAAD